MISFLKENEQHQHPNGGGWVANTATVAASAFEGFLGLASKAGTVSHG